MEFNPLEHVWFVCKNHGQIIPVFFNTHRSAKIALVTAAPGKKVLVVEDEADVVEMLVRAFKRAAGFNVITADDGAIGLRRAREESPALVILGSKNCCSMASSFLSSSSAWATCVFQRASACNADLTCAICALTVSIRSIMSAMMLT